MKTESHLKTICWIVVTALLAFGASPQAQEADPNPGAARAAAAAAARRAAAQNQPAPAPATGIKPAPAGDASPPITVAAPQGPPSNQNPEADVVGPNDEIQLSFQSANIELVVQWLAKTTGKSVVKHPRAQCQLTIVSSKKLKARDAINLVYRALALEGFTTIESSKSILIVPEGQEPKLNPELVDAKQTELPDGRQKLIKIFPLENIQAAEARDKIKGVLSEKATVEISDRANQLIITDYTDNIRLAGELLKALDVASGGDTVIEFFPLKYSEAEELGNLLSAILNSQPAPPAASSTRPMTRSSSSSGPMFGPPFMSSNPDMSSSSSSSSSTPPGGANAGTMANQAVKIWPDRVSNRLIVAAQRSKMAEVKRLLETLDTEKPQDVAIRTLPLKNVSAEDLVRDLAPLYQKMSGKSLKEMIEISANTRANSLIVLSSESNFKMIEKLITTLDTEDAQEKAMRSFPLKNADAEDVAKQLQDLNQDQSNNRYPFYYYSYSMSDRPAKKSNFVADRRRNTVIVQAAPTSMESIEKLIKALDEPVSDDSLTPRIIRLKFVSATDIEDVLNELFLKKQQQRNYWDPYGYPNMDRGDSQNTGRLYGKVRITSEPYANAIIVTSNSKESMGAVEEIIKQLDMPSQAGETTLRVGLKFAKAATVANNINILFAKNGSPPLRGGTPQQNQQQPAQQYPQQQTQTSQTSFALEQEAKEDGYFPWLGGQQDNFRGLDGKNVNRPVSDLVGRVRVVPDQRSNSLLMSANVHFFPELIKLVDQMDAPTSQVLIEARLVEVSSDFMDKLGVRWSPDGTRTFTADDLDNSLLGQVNGDYRKGFGSTTTVNSPPAGGALQALTSLRSGVLSSSVSMDFLIQFLRKTTDATVLAQPQINIADNEIGKLFVGQQVPIPDNTQISQLGGQNTTIRYKEVGVILEVTPHINSTGDIALKIRTESSTIVSGQLVLGGAIFDTRNFKTDLTAKNGETLVLGGIIQKQMSDTLRKTPILGSIPGLGWAFKKKDKSTREVELLVFLRPKIVRTPEEARELMIEMDKKAPLIRQFRDVEEHKMDEKLEKQRIEKDRK